MALQTYPPAEWRHLGVPASDYRAWLTSALANEPSIVAWYDAALGVTSASERVSEWANQLGSAGSLLQGTGANQPILLPDTGVTYFANFGLTDGATMPDNSGIASITGDMALVFRVAMNSWTPSGDSDFIRNDDWQFYLKVTTGLLRFDIGAKTHVSTAATGLGAFVEKYIAATLKADNGAGGHVVNFFTSDDGVTFTQLGTSATQQTDTITITDTGSLVKFFGIPSSRAPSGKAYRAIIYKGIPTALGGSGGEVLVTDADFTKVPEGATSFTESSSNAATVTIVATGATPAQIVVAGQPSVMGNQVAYWMQTGAITIPAPYALIGVKKANAWGSGNVAVDGRTANSFALQQITGTPQERLHDALADSGTISPTLGAWHVFAATQAADGSATLKLNLGAPVAATLSATGLGGVSLLADGAGANFAADQFKALTVFSSVPSAAQVTRIAQLMSRVYGGFAL